MGRTHKSASSGPDVEPVSSSEDRLQRIAQRAYELHLSRGSEHGHDLDDWLEAEREIDAAA